MKIIKHRERIEQTKYFRFFESKSCPGSGFSFDCDKDGNLLTPYSNYESCLTNPDLMDRGVKNHSWSYYDPAVGECGCGYEVVLDGFTNTCESCERDYNSSGQLLAPREQWGEDTGEHLSDILRIK